MNQQRICVITDTGTDTPADFCAKHDVRVVPLRVNYSDGSSYESGVDITTDEVVARFGQEVPKTSLPSPERIADAFGGGWDAFVGFVQGLVIALVYLWPVVLIAIAVLAALRFWRKRHPKAPKAPKPIQTPPPAEYAVKNDNEPKPKY